MGQFTERTQQRADHTEVRDDSQSSAGVRTDQFIHDRMGTLLQLSQILAGAGPNVETPSVEAPQGITARTFDLVARQAFPFADVEFAQSRVQLRAKVVRFPDDRGSFNRATEIARNDYVDRFVSESRSESGGSPCPCQRPSAFQVDSACRINSSGASLKPRSRFETRAG